MVLQRSGESSWAVVTEKQILLDLRKNVNTLAWLSSGPTLPQEVVARSPVVKPSG